MILARRLRAVSRRPLLAAAVVVPAAIFVSAAWFDYLTERDRVREQVVSTTAALSEHAQKVVETTDLVLGRVFDSVRDMDWTKIQASRELHDLLNKFCKELPQVESVFLVSPAGLNVATTRAFPLPSVPDVSDREYFRKAREGNLGIFVSDPFRSRLDNSYAFTATQAFRRQDRFDGLAGATISPKYLSAFYTAVVDYPGHSTATLIRDDGTVLFRYPAQNQFVTRLPRDSALMEAIARHPEQGSYLGQSSMDGRSRFGAYRRLSSQPLYIAYSIDNAVYLRRWQLNLLFLFAFSSLLAAALLLLERMVTRRAETELRASRELMAETERRQKAELALEQAQKAEALGRLTGGVAHDFNNLLTAILGPLELAAKRTADARLLRLIEAATEAAQRGARLTRQMLAITRSNDIAAELLDPTAIVREMQDILQHSVGPLIQARFELDPGASPILANKVNLETTVLNLSVNARDAMPDGGEITVRTGRRTVGYGDPPGLPAGEYILVAVSDNGRGMSEEVRARALEPFFTTKEPGKGTGLGLAGADSFARSSGGGLTIDSGLGSGTTVTLFIPKARGTVEPVVSSPSVVRQQLSRHVLLVDDDPAVRLVTRSLLEDQGHTVIDVGSGAEALDAIDRGSACDLLVTDYAMPGMVGSVLAERVRQRLPDIPILFVTGYAKDNALEDWSNRNASVLAKPFRSQELAAAVESVFRRPPVCTDPNSSITA